jgi:hypothetical protein
MPYSRRGGPPIAPPRRNRPPSAAQSTRGDARRLPWDNHVAAIGVITAKLRGIYDIRVSETKLELVVVRDKLTALTPVTSSGRKLTMCEEQMVLTFKIEELMARLGRYQAAIDEYDELHDPEDTCSIAEEEE